MNGSEELQIVDTYDKVEQVIANVAAVRDAVGPHVGIGVDFHGRVHKPMAKVLAKARSVQADVHRGAGAVGERRGAARHRQPDQHADRARRAALLALGFQAHPRGRLRRHHPARRIACGRHHRVPQDRDARGELRRRARAALPACIALAACLQLDAVSYNAFIQEQSLGIHYNQATTCSTTCATPRCSATRTASSRSRRLGIDVNEEKVREMAKTGHRWRNPVWRHEDGSVAEW